MMSRDQVLPAAEECTSIQPDLPRSQHGLAALPLELLEETASYLSTSDAAKAVTVCSVLHEGFAHRVWRHLGEDRADGVKHIPASAWQRYGHLVRAAYISAKTIDSIPLEHISGVVRLTVELDCVETVALNRAVKDMINIQSVSVIQGDGQELTHQQLPAVNGWILYAKRRGHIINVEWNVGVHSSCNLLFLCDAIGYIAPSTQHTYKLTASKLFRIPLDEVVDIATSLKELELTGDGSITSFFGSDGATNHFPVLRKLVLKFNVRAKIKHGREWATFNPSQLPVLSSLRITFYSGVLKQIYAHTWPTITELSLFWVLRREVCEQLIKKLPNLTQLTILHSSLSLPIEVLAVCTPRLEYVNIFATDWAYFSASEPTALLPSLKELSLTSTREHDRHLIPMEYGILSIILDRFPNLQSLKLIGYSYHKTDFKQFSGRINKSVQSISIVDGTSVKNIPGIAKMLALFPKTKQLTFNSLDAADLQKMKQLLPGVVVIAKEIKEYESDDSESESESDFGSGSNYDSASLYDYGSDSDYGNEDTDNDVDEDTNNDSDDVNSDEE
ncbi:hypothetical protein GQ42DRAFT_176540 [Ramicandelaber brevisporus]|nr:hypothetical protein GQ42DRAFT_176540 [Ramicandelaber brevisporus]